MKTPRFLIFFFFLISFISTTKVYCYIGEVYIHVLNSGGSCIVATVNVYKYNPSTSRFEFYDSGQSKSTPDYNGFNAAFDLGGYVEVVDPTVSLLPGGETYCIRIGNSYYKIEYSGFGNYGDMAFTYQNGIFLTSYTNSSGYDIYGPYTGDPSFSVSISGPLEIYHPSKGDPLPTYTWNADVVNGTSPYSYHWYKNGNLIGTGSSYSTTLTYDGTYPAFQWQLRIDVTDNSSPQQTVTSTVYITEHSAGDDPLPKIGINTESVILPMEFEIQQNYPNPFNPVTTIKYAIPQNDFVTLKVYDILGREIATLVNEEKQPGYYEVKFDGSKYSSGMYIYKITGNNLNLTKKMILMK